MTFKEFRAAVAPLAMLRKEVKDVPTWEVYYLALVFEPAPTLMLVQRALVRSALRRFFPAPGELREDCEFERLALIKANPYEPCAKCHHTGWADVHKDGVRYAKRCACHDGYLRVMAKLGCGGQALSVQLELPAGVDDAT